MTGNASAELAALVLPTLASLLGWGTGTFTGLGFTGGGTGASADEAPGSGTTLALVSAGSNLALGWGTFTGLGFTGGRTDAAVSEAADSDATLA